MITIIAGTRDVPIKKACELVCNALEDCGFASDITKVIQGGARGIDRAAKLVCDGFYETQEVPAQWDKFGHQAGPIRNAEMAEMANALVAVWDGYSSGTRNMISVAKKRGLKVYVYRYNPHDYTKVTGYYV